jgi:hypothetical protein
MWSAVTNSLVAIRGGISGMYRKLRSYASAFGR